MRTNQSDHARVDQVLDSLLRTPAERAQALIDLRRYFGPAIGANEYYEGSWFERLDDGGDRPDIANTVTSSDVVALSLLSVRVSGSIALELLVRQREAITQLLTSVPAKPLHQVERKEVASDSAAGKLWNLIKHLGENNERVMAYKLLARKRPHLLPVYDRVVAHQLGHPHNVWDGMWTWFDSDPRRLVELMELRAEVGGIDDISLLRCMDVALWMRGRRVANRDAT